MPSFVSVVPLHDLRGCGEVEMLLWFCSLVSEKSKPVNKPYHIHFLEEALLKKVRLWPVFMERYEIFKQVHRAYREALRKHFALRPNGPLPQQVTYYPRFNTLRYVTKSKVVITLRLAEGLDTPILTLQSLTEEQMLKYVKFGHPVIRVDTNHALTFDEIYEMPISFGSAFSF